MTIALVAFDIGGVLVSVDKNQLIKLLPAYSKIESFFDESFSLLQRGVLAPRDFLQNKAQQLSICPKALKLSFAYMIRCSPHLYTAINELTVPYTFMSNINELHYQSFIRHYKFSDFARQKAQLSCRLGLLKPHPRFFWHAIKMLNVDPRRIAYIDDQEMNVCAAKKAGFVGVMCPTLEALPSLLRDLGCTTQTKF